jgi:hypothetical protein
MVQNCYAISTIEGYYYEDMNDAMLRGNPRSVNCYSTVPDKNAIVVTPEQVTNGELCYMLNQNMDAPVWRQTLGEDDHPVLDATHGIVMLADDGTYYSENHDGIREVHSSQSIVRSEEAIYNLAGQQIVNGTPRLQSRLGSKESKKLSNGKLPRGINIIRTPDGKTRKFIVK